MLLQTGFMTESIKIIQQALEGIPKGAYNNIKIKTSLTIKASW